MTAGTHGTTYGGNPLAMAVGNAVLDIVLAPGFLDEVARKGVVMRQKLAGLRDAHPAIVKGVRGQGLMIGLETHVTPADFVGAARAQQLLSVPAGDNVTRLLPPLVVSDAELSESVARLERACVALEKTRGASS